MSIRKSELLNLILVNSDDIEALDNRLKKLEKKVKKLEGKKEKKSEVKK